jgi:hypothetical protein
MRCSKSGGEKRREPMNCGLCVQAEERARKIETQIEEERFENADLADSEMTARTKTLQQPHWTKG